MLRKGEPRNQDLGSRWCHPSQEDLFVVPAGSVSAGSGLITLRGMGRTDFALSLVAKMSALHQGVHKSPELCNYSPGRSDIDTLILACRVRRKSSNANHEKNRWWPRRL